MKIYSYLSDRHEIKEDVKYVETSNLQKVGDSLACEAQTQLTSWLEITAQY